MNDQQLLDYVLNTLLDAATPRMQDPLDTTYEIHLFLSPTEVPLTVETLKATFEASARKDSELRCILEDFGASIDPQGFDDGDYRSAISRLKGTLR